MSSEQADFPGLETSKFQFILLGAGRSGTSLLTALMDEHPQVQVGFEMFGNSCLRGKELEENESTMFYDRASSFINNCIAEGNKSAKPIWGNKITTEKLAGLNKHNLYNKPPVDVLETFFNDYLSGMKVIYIIRDGRSCIKSKLKRTEQSLEQACSWWKYAVEVYEFLQARENTFFLRFEDLLADPRKELTGVFNFLGVDFDPRVMEGTMSPKLQEAYRRPAISQSRALDVETDHPCVEFIADELARCGYV